MASTCVISILRLQSLYVISKTKDITWYNPLAAIWSSVEANTAMLCSCLPTLRGLISRLFPKIFSTNRSSSDPKDRPRDDSDSKPSTHTPQQSLGHQARKSLEALGRSLAGIGETRLKNSVSGRTENNSNEIELNEFEPSSNVDDGQIQVVTVVEQDVENIGEHRVTR